MAYIVVTCIVMAYIVMAYIVLVYVVMAHTAMATGVPVIVIDVSTRNTHVTHVTTCPARTHAHTNECTHARTHASTHRRAYVSVHTCVREYVYAQWTAYGRTVYF